jgi:hypothetical protein
MRHKSRTALAALVAVFAISAVAAASASAAYPEFVPGEGESFPIGLSLSKSAHTSRIHAAAPVGLEECASLAFKGEISGAKAYALTAELGGCGYGGTSACSTKGAESGTIVLSGSGSPVYIEKATKKVGILFNLHEVEVSCGGFGFRLRHSIVIPVSPVNTKTSALTLSIKEGRSLQNEYRSYENEKGEKVSAYLQESWSREGWTEADWSAGEPTLTTSKPVTLQE